MIDHFHRKSLAGMVTPSTLTCRTEFTERKHTLMENAEI